MSLSTILVLIPLSFVALVEMKVGVFAPLCQVTTEDSLLLAVLLLEKEARCHIVLFDET